MIIIRHCVKLIYALKVSSEAVPAILRNQNGVYELRHRILIVLKEEFDNFRCVDFFGHSIDAGNDLSEPERLGRVRKELVTSKCNVA